MTIGRLGAMLAVACMVVLAWASPTWAHATLTSSIPADGTTAGGGLDRISLQFDEPVEVPLGAVRLFASSGEQITVDDVELNKGDERSIAVSVSALPDDAYVLAYRVVSADSHPVQGVLSFGVGESSVADTQLLASEVLGKGEAGSITGWIFGIDRFLLLLSTMLVGGALMFLAYVLPSGWSDERTRRTLLVSALVALAATFAAIPLQSRYAAGLSWSSFTKPDVLIDVLSTRYASAQLVRAVALVIAMVSIYVVPRRRFGWLDATVTTAVAVGIIAPTSFVGHAATDELPAVAILLDILHLGGASLWIGGLALLLFSVLRARVDEQERVDTVVRFSPIAMGAVAVIITTGAYRAVREVGNLAALTSSTYGRLLLLKLFVFAAFFSVAMRSHRWLQRRRRSGSGTLSGLRRFVLGEAIIAIVVVAVTAALIGTAPTRAAGAEPYSTQLIGRSAVVAITVDPAGRGSNTMHIYIQSPTGEVMDVPEVRASLELTNPSVGPQAVELDRVTGWHYLAETFTIPLAGKWRLDVIVRTTEIDQETLSTSFDVS